MKNINFKTQTAFYKTYRRPYHRKAFALHH